MKRIALVLVPILAAAPLAAAAPALLTHFAPAALGGITGLIRYTVARPDRSETRFVFLTTPTPGGLPEEVQVVDPTLPDVQLADVEGADCTLAHVEVVTGRRPLVISATRVPAARLEDNVQSSPQPMNIRLYRPRTAGDTGQSQIVLAANGAPTRTAPLCDLAAVRAAMLAATKKN
ncbi:hypothetical protein [Sphingomonas sp.]|uniref:hypothetical protein n=1 Tax=Sphingomonas sp. TaxID=28214 RepID=UPI003AFFBA96